jgi:hypothetical protein
MRAARELLAYAVQLIVRAQDLESQGRYSCAAELAGQAATRLLLAQKLLAQQERLDALRAERMPVPVARC